MTADFSNLGKLAITDETEAEYVFRDIVIRLDGDGAESYPSAFFAAGIDSNKAFHNAKMRMINEEAEAMKKESPTERKRRILGTDLEEEERQRWRVLIASTCIRRWGEPLPAKDGKVYDLDDEANRTAFIMALPDQIFDPLRNWVANAYNFFDRRALVVDGETLGNSSPTGSSGS